MSSLARLLPPKGTRASLAIAGPASADFDTVIEAQADGPSGNSITLAATGDNDALTKAELDLDTVTGDLDTIVEAVTGGAAGNDITVTVVGDSAAAGGVTIDEDGTSVTIHFETGVSTVADVETAITATATLIAVKTAGTAITVLDSATDECTAEALAGGLDSEGVTFSVTGSAIACHYASGESTVADFEAALLADAAVSALVRVKTAGTGANILVHADGDTFVATALTGGGSTSSSTPTLTDETVGATIVLGGPCDRAVILVVSHAGSGTMTATVALWGWCDELGTWIYIGALNNGSAIAEGPGTTNAIVYSEEVAGLRPFSKLYATLSVAGTGTEIGVYAHAVRATSGSRS